jgi:cation transporter-like permease
MDEQKQEDWLDARLRAEAPYIDDAGFSARVVGQLPVRRARNSLRAIILLGATVLASAIAYVISGDGHFIIEAFAHLTQWSLLTLVLLAIGCGFLLTAAGSLVAIAKIREQQSLGSGDTF